MQLPFTKEQFFDLLAAYNLGLWPALLALWIASVLVCMLLLSSRRPPDGSRARALVVRLMAQRMGAGLIGGSAAFLLGVRADYGLPIAGIALAIFSTQRRSHAGGSRNAPSQPRPVTQRYQK